MFEITVSLCHLPIGSPLCRDRHKDRQRALSVQRKVDPLSVKCDELSWPSATIEIAVTSLGSPCLYPNFR